MVDHDRLLAACETARCDLRGETAPAGCWIGEPASSALATATAISALAIAERHAPLVAGRIVDEARETAVSELIVSSLRWLARNQNKDGGWSHADAGPSDLAATLLVRSAFALTCVPADRPGLLERADLYIRAQGGVRALTRSEPDARTIPILTNYALAGLAPWRQVPFDRACWSDAARWLLGIDGAASADPLLVALGQTRYFFRKPRNPFTRLWRWWALGRSQQVVEQLQPGESGLLVEVPATSFLVMSLASTQRAEHPLVHEGIEFLLAACSADGSWPLAVPRRPLGAAMFAPAVAHPR